MEHSAGGQAHTTLTTLGQSSTHPYSKERAGMQRLRMLLLGMTAALLLALLAACAGINDDDDATEVVPTTPTIVVGEPTASTDAGQSSDPTATETETAAEPSATPAPEEPTATAAVDDPTATPDDAPATQAPEDEVLLGMAVVEDETDDITDLLGNEPDDPLPGIDIVRVELVGDGSSLTVTIETAGDIQSAIGDDEEVSFDVHIWQDDMPAYAMSFHGDSEGEWEATVTDFSEMMDETTVDTEISLNGNTLSATFPGDMMPDVEPSFEWYSSVMLGTGELFGLAGWFDGAPDNVFALIADPEKFEVFPQ
jgi:hypothetical protein